MVSRDYTKEINLESTSPRVPWPIAALVIGGCAAAVWFGIARLQANAHGAKPVAEATTAAVQTAGAD